MSNINFKMLQTIQNAAANLNTQETQVRSCYPTTKTITLAAGHGKMWLQDSCYGLYFFWWNITFIFIKNIIINPMSIKESLFLNWAFLNTPQDKSQTFWRKIILFNFTAPKIWNHLPRHQRHACSLGVFKKNLKTYMFKKHFNDWSLHIWHSTGFNIDNERRNEFSSC